VQFPALFRTLTKTAIAHPGLVLKIIPQAGPLALANWLRHYLTLAAYSALYPIAKTLEPRINTLPTPRQYYLRRWVQALEYGSGGDYEGIGNE
jgi:lycopene cyclase CruP